MRIEINGETYYRTLEACRKAGISRGTLLRWLEEGILKEPRRDRRGWRLFTVNDLNIIGAEVTKISAGRNRAIVR